MCSPCNALVAGVSCSPGALLHECDSLLQPRSSASVCDAVAARCLGFSCGPLPNRWSLSLARGLWMHPLQSRYGRVPGCEACFSLRTGFGPAANEMANGSGRRHYCASATTIGDCYIVKYLFVHTPNYKIGSVNCSHIARPEEAALTKRGLRPGGGVDLGVAPAVLEDARS